MTFDDQEHLKGLGWGAYFQDQLTIKDVRRGPPGRIVEAFRKSFIVHTGHETLHAMARGAMFHRATTPQDLPAVGDWVVLDRVDKEQGRARVWRVLERRSVLIRKAAGETTRPQVIAANIDTIFIVTSFNQDFNLRRLERYLALVHESGATPVIVINKADLSKDHQSFMEQIDEVASDVERMAVSMMDGLGFELLKARARPRETIALIGSSGVGKSTIINELSGTDRQLTGSIRETDGRGRHTTTTRQLIVLPNSALMIDTPGMRELHLWHSESGIKGSFEDIASIASQCKFRDCMHGGEVGCAVKNAVESGDLDVERLVSWQKLQDERLEQMERKQELERVQKKRASSSRRWRKNK